MQHVIQYNQNFYNFFINNFIGAGEASADVPEGEEEKTKHDNAVDEGNLFLRLYKGVI